MGSVYECKELLGHINEIDIGFVDFNNHISNNNYSNIVDGPFDIRVPFLLRDGKPQSGYVGDTIVDTITILNNSKISATLWRADIYDSKPKGSFTLSYMEPPGVDSDVDYIEQYLESTLLEDRVLQPGKPLTIWLSCKPEEIGLHTAAVHLSIEENMTELLVFVLAEDKLSESLAGKKTYKRVSKKKQWSNLVSNNDFVPGSRPPRASAQVFKYKLPLYPIPEDIRDLLEQRMIPEIIEDGLRRENYALYFKHLVIMEELKMEDDIRGYDMDHVTMKSKGSHFLTLEVPGLAEKRPSLVYGDCIFARLASDDENDSHRVYQGYIHRVEAEVVFLKFEQGFHSSYNSRNPYNVQFTYNRINMRRLYQAIEATQSLEAEFLFPADSRRSRAIQTSPLVPISFFLNEEQKSAVQMILGCNGGAPYVIYGPPGTGKTMTLIEAILQLYTNQRNAKVLVCAPSNSAADHILEKVLNESAGIVQRKEILRLNALTRPLEDIKPAYIPFCYYDEAERLFRCPSVMDLRRFKLIVSTYASSALLYAEGIKRGHFSHIFLDEAGQASEPETMVPLSSLCSKKTVVVLAGDPKQLGPVIYSKDAERFGLGKSFLERLFEFEYYGRSDPNYVIKLVRNYRCHPEILHLPSKLFYEDELLACKDEDTRLSATYEHILPNKDFPVFFFGIQGLDEREGSNPSWFNRIEASKTVEIIRNLVEEEGLYEEDIGVIAPYRQQVLKIKTALEGLDLSDIQVGSVEQFQGQERQVIIVSTVRSTIMHNDFDMAHCLGFLSNPRRFNVAITRARSLLIVIGNPHIVCKDPYWNKLLWYCVDHKSYRGCFLPDRENLLDDLAAQQKAAVVFDPPCPEDESSYPPLPEDEYDPPWPEDESSYPPLPKDESSYPPLPEDEYDPPWPEDESSHPPLPEDESSYPPLPEDESSYQTGGWDDCSYSGASTCGYHSDSAKPQEFPEPGWNM